MDANDETPRRYEVRSTPTLLLLVDGQERHRIVGPRDKRRLLRECERFLVT